MTLPLNIQADDPAALWRASPRHRNCNIPSIADVIGGWLVASEPQLSLRQLFDALHVRAANRASQCYMNIHSPARSLHVNCCYACRNALSTTL